MIGSAVAIALGLAVGARHAFEPDHLAAVSTLIGRSRSTRGAVGLGLLWGVGHTIALLAVGIGLIALDGVMPARVGNIFELAVAAMLLVLGVRAIVNGLWPAHAGDDHVHSPTIAWRPLTTGLIHGLAGSGALTALAFAELPSTGARVLYMLMFGIGSIAGMAAATGITGAALQRVARGPHAHRYVSLAAGTLACIVGVLWALPIIS